MPVVVVCPGCGQRFRVPDGPRGTAARCPKCGAVIPLAASGTPAGVEAKRAPDLSLGDRATRGPGTAAADPSGLPEAIQVAGRYTLGAILGRGGMGAVYRAEDSRPRRPVALKFLAPREGTAEAAVARFLAEAETIARLAHLNILQVYDVGEWDHEGRAHRYIAMELVEGGSLRDLLRERRKLPVPEASGLMRQVGQALSHAHRQGVIHRDLKPANVLLTRDGVPKLADFGLAKGATESDLSVSGHAMGTLGFMSPEQRQDAKSVDHRTDIYAWGATFYQVVTGKDPLAWDPDEIPREVSAVIRKCLKDREGRYFSMDDAMTALESALRSPGQAAGGRAEPMHAAIGACPKCGMANAQQDSRFCQGCGAGLYAKCPACAKEIRAGLRFCGGCGVEVEKVATFRDLIAQGTKLATEGDFARAAEPLEAACALMPANGEAKSLLADVRQKTSEIARLRHEAEEAQGREDYEHAQELSRQILEMAPRDLTAGQVLRDAEFGIDRQYAALSLKGAQSARERHDLEGALSLAESARARYQRMEGDTEFADENASAQAELATLLAKLVKAKAECDRAVEEAEALVTDKRFADAREVLDPVLERWDYGPAREVDARAEKALAERGRALHFAKRAVAAGRPEEALERLNKARKIQRAPEVDALRGEIVSELKLKRQSRRFVVGGSVVLVIAALAVVLAVGRASDRGRVRITASPRPARDAPRAENPQWASAVSSGARAAALVSEARAAAQAGDWRTALSKFDQADVLFREADWAYERIIGPSADMESQARAWKGLRLAASDERVALDSER